MPDIQTILTKLQEVARWEDGEHLQAARNRLTAQQLAGPGLLVLRLSLRGSFPGMIRACVFQDGLPLFEAQQRLTLSREDVENLAKEWQAAGYLTEVTITPPPNEQ